VTEYEEALQIVPGYFQCLANLAWVLAAAPDASLRNGARLLNWRRAPMNFRAGKIRGSWAYGGGLCRSREVCRCDSHGPKGVAICRRPGNAAVGNLLRSQLALYQAGRRFGTPRWQRRLLRRAARSVVSLKWLYMKSGSGVPPLFAGLSTEPQRRDAAATLRYL